MRMFLQIYLQHGHTIVYEELLSGYSTERLTLIELYLRPILSCSNPSCPSKGTGRLMSRSSSRFGLNFTKYGQQALLAADKATKRISLKLQYSK